MVSQWRSRVNASATGDADGSNESTAQTDDPAGAGANEPTSVAVNGLAAVAIPTVSLLALTMLGGLLAGAGWLVLRRG